MDTLIFDALSGRYGLVSSPQRLMTVSEVSDVCPHLERCHFEGDEGSFRCGPCASAIEARRAETAQHGSVADESAVPQGDARD